jgi:hypothetical protein
MICNHPIDSIKPIDNTPLAPGVLIRRQTLSVKCTPASIVGSSFRELELVSQNEKSGFGLVLAIVHERCLVLWTTTPLDKQAININKSQWLTSFVNVEANNSLTSWQNVPVVSKGI